MSLNSYSPSFHLSLDDEGEIIPVDIALARGFESMEEMLEDDSEAEKGLNSNRVAKNTTMTEENKDSLNFRSIEELEGILKSLDKNEHGADSSLISTVRKAVENTIFKLQNPKVTKVDFREDPRRKSDTSDNNEEDAKVYKFPTFYTPPISREERRLIQSNIASQAAAKKRLPSYIRVVK